MTKEQQIEEALIAKLKDLKYSYREDIRDRASLEQNFREKFEALNCVNLTNAEFSRLRDEIVNPDVFTASKTLRERNTFQRETVRHCNIRWLISKTGAKTNLKSSTSYESIPIIVIIVTM